MREECGWVFKNCDEEPLMKPLKEFRKENPRDVRECMERGIYGKILDGITWHILKGILGKKILRKSLNIILRKKMGRVPGEITVRIPYSISERNTRGIYERMPASILKGTSGQISV